MDTFGINPGAKPHNDHPFVNKQRVRVTVDGRNYSQGEHGVVVRDNYLNCVRVLLDGADQDVNIPVSHLVPAGKSTALM